jgi:hypothetical protein
MKPEPMFTNPTLANRRVVGAVVVAALMVTAGCTSGVPGLGGGGGGDAPAAADVVPQDVDFVTSLDVRGLATDETLNDLANSTLNDAGQPVEDTGDARESFREQTGLSPAEVQRVVVFARSADSPTASEYGAFVVETSWTNDEVVEAVQNQSTQEFEETTYAGKTVYHPGSEGPSAQDSWLGILDDGRYVAGNEQAVKDAIDVAVGDADSMSGELRSLFQDTSNDAYVRFAAAVPEGSVPADQVGSGSQFNTSSLNQVTMVAGSHAVSGENLSATVNMRIASSSAAEDVKNAIDGVLSLYSATAGDETIAAVVEDVSVSRSGDTVTVTTETPASEIEALLEMFAGQPAIGAGGPTAATV